MSATSGPESWNRRRWVKQFMLGSALAFGPAHTWSGSLLADISPSTPPSDILTISLDDFPSLMDGSTPSVQLQLSAFDEVIMINRAPFNGNFYVLDSRCTHQGCPVNKWDVNNGIVCPCHGSMYNIDGSLVFGAAGPSQPPLPTYNFFHDDAANLLKIEVPGLNLKINSMKVETSTPTNKRLRLTFPVRLGSDYQVTHSTDLKTWTGPVSFATTAGGSATETQLRASTTDPQNVWVDSPDLRGFYRIEIVLANY